MLLFNKFAWLRWLGEGGELRGLDKRLLLLAWGGVINETRASKINPDLEEEKIQGPIFNLYLDRKSPEMPG